MNGDNHQFSASQIESWEMCPRKWAWRKIEGVESAPKKSLEFGKEVHAQLESWLRDAVPLNMTTEAGHVAMSGLHHLPAPSTPGLEIEKEFHLDVLGHHFIGFKDFQILARAPPLVGDHKTTTDFKWAKTPDDLVNNVQACLYATDAMFRANSNECDLQWVYYKTTGAKQSKVVHLRVTRSMVEPTMERAIRSCNEIKTVLALGLRARDLPFNATACEAYGGCEYQQHCNLSAEERMRAVMSQQKVSDFLTQLQHRSNGINPPPVPIQATMNQPPQMMNQPPQMMQQPMQQQPVNQQQPPPPPQPVWNPSTGAYEIPQPQMQQQQPQMPMQPQAPMQQQPQMPQQQAQPPMQPQMQMQMQPQMQQQQPPPPPQPVWNPATGQYELPGMQSVVPGQPPGVLTTPVETTAAAPPKRRGRPPKATTAPGEEGDMADQLATLLEQAADMLKTAAKMARNL